MSVRRPVTYYEELGVHPASSVEEIREAYKQLARLLHPDKLRDERSRIVAECQMKRLNSVYETLTHADKRLVYDRSIGIGVVPEPLEPDDDRERDQSTRINGHWIINKLRGPNGAWVGAGVIVLLLIGWTLADSTARPRPPIVIEPAVSLARPSPQTVSQPAADHADAQIQHLRRQVETLSAERAAALQQVASLERRLAEAVNRSTPTPEPPPAVASITPSPGSSEPAHAPPKSWTAPPRTDLAGTWYYASHPLTSGRGLYPPEFIEAEIREESGYLVGRYRARYRVSDRAISPEVIFQFSGKGGASAARLPWLGSGGARGEVSLKLLTQNTIEIAWIASDLGRTQGLGSGTAVLVRRHEP